MDGGVGRSADSQHTLSPRSSVARHASLATMPPCVNAPLTSSWSMSACSDASVWEAVVVGVVVCWGGGGSKLSMVQWPCVRRWVRAEVVKGAGRGVVGVREEAVKSGAEVK